jgi:hypothetical protein
MGGNVPLPPWIANRLVARLRRQTSVRTLLDELSAGGCRGADPEIVARPTRLDGRDTA